MPEDFGFGKFADNAFYRQVNQGLVDSVDLNSSQRIVDLACGTGLLTRLLIEKLRDAKNTVVIGIDQSSGALRRAKEELGNVQGVVVQFIQSQIEQMSANLRESVDTVILGNGIHMVEGKQQLAAEVFKILRPGGTFAFNTTFFDGGIPTESEQYYRRWMSKALRTLRSTYGLMPDRGKVESRQHLSAQEYRDLLQDAGFHITKEDLIPVEFTLQGHEDISEYEDFITGALPGVPLKKASQVLQEAARQSYEELGLTFVLRNWLQVVAMRPQV